MSVSTDVMPVSPSDTTRTAAGVRRARHWEMLVIASVAIAASFLLDVEGGSRVHILGLPTWALPQTCFSRELFDVDCPGCGLTRSFVYLAHFDWQASWQMHRLGWLMFLATLVQIPYRAGALWSRRGNIVPLPVAKAFGGVLIGLLIVNWLAGLVLASAAG